MREEKAGKRKLGRAWNSAFGKESSTPAASASNYRPMRLKESHENGVVIFALSGAIDLHYAATLRSLFQSKLNERCPALIVDLSAVDFRSEERRVGKECRSRGWPEH